MNHEELHGTAADERRREPRARRNLGEFDRWEEWRERDRTAALDDYELEREYREQRE
jgi:hypothetical protein